MVKSRRSILANSALTECRLCMICIKSAQMTYTFFMPDAEQNKPAGALPEEWQNEIASAEETRFELQDASPEEKAQLHSAGISLLERVACLSVAERVKAALMGTREERMLLIRDRNRLVQRAVLQSPRTDDRDAEQMAGMHNVGEDALRLIAAERRFRKHLPVLRNLARNPHTPLIVALEIQKLLPAPELEKLARDRNISEPVRRAARQEAQRRAGH